MYYVTFSGLFGTTLQISGTNVATTAISEENSIVFAIALG